MFWIEEEPANPEPYKYTYELDMLGVALKLNPLDQAVLISYGKMLVGKISMNQHELDSGYLYNGNPKEDYEKLSSYEHYIKNISDSLVREQLRNQLTELKQSALMAIK